MPITLLTVSGGEDVVISIMHIAESSEVLFCVESSGEGSGTGVSFSHVSSTEISAEFFRSCKRKKKKKLYIIEINLLFERHYLHVTLCHKEIGNHYV